MARFRERVTVGTPKSLSVPFEAQMLQIKNPTPSTLYVRQGSRDIPSQSNADYYIMPTSAEVISVEGHEFGFAFGTPTIAYNLQGTAPTDAALLFLAGEFPPQLATLPLVESVGSGLQTVIGSKTNRPAAIYNDLYEVPANIRTIVLVSAFGASITQLVIAGNQTGITYFDGNPSNMFAEFPLIYIPWQRSLDSQLQVNINSLGGTNNAYTVFGTVYDYPQRANRSDGRQKVDVFPFGTASLPVNVTNFTNPQQTFTKLDGTTANNTVNLLNNTATLLSLGLGSRKALGIYNASGVPIYVGGSTVTVANGWQIVAGAKEMFAAGSISLYAIQNSGVTQTIRLFELS